MRVVMCILIISFTIIFGMSCERHMEQQVSYTEADSLNILLMICAIKTCLLL